jgi:hypothetical protein
MRRKQRVAKRRTRLKATTPALSGSPVDEDSVGAEVPVGGTEVAVPVAVAEVAVAEVVDTLPAEEVAVVDNIPLTEPQPAAPEHLNPPVELQTVIVAGRQLEVSAAHREVQGA